MNSECLACQAKTISHIASKFGSDKKVTAAFVEEANYIVSNSQSLSTPYSGLLLHRLAKRIFKTEDLYASEKLKANKILQLNYSHWKSLVSNSDNPLYVAAKLAVIGNIIDYGAHTAPDDIVSEIEHLLQKEFALNESEEMFEAIKNAKSVLYLGDNAGEIVFDKLFIETLNHPNLTFVVRGEPIINDVTFEDSQYVKMEDVCKVISNGHDAPSTLLENCSSEFQKLYRDADVVISKGQGNLEGLLNEKRDKLFFMLMAKCDLIAGKLGVKKKDLVIKQNKK
ncbi:ARMT1-like domain-containing protein [Marinifilum fragile]|uniref:damage-control phosphatase ARMT1 family protein n=1 Tax=Marinifilum fragile TaxID=570161 RepID=UPI002AA948F5|nr:ARMT1-like domain-containing protein [Marinifilum fragile]